MDFARAPASKRTPSHDNEIQDPARLYITAELTQSEYYGYLFRVYVLRDSTRVAMNEVISESDN